MKDIRIFIASSEELLPEYNALAYLVLAKEEFEQRGFRVRLAKCEYGDSKMTVIMTEDRYLDEMYNCDAALVIFKNIAGKYNREELDKTLAKEAVGVDCIKVAQDPVQYRRCSGKEWPPPKERYLTTSLDYLGVLMMVI